MRPPWIIDGASISHHDILSCCCALCALGPAAATMTPDVDNLLNADITTKDLITDSRQLWHNAPCLPGGYRSPASLARTWHLMCCLPFTFRSWGNRAQNSHGQQQQQAWRLHQWQQVPSSEEDGLSGVHNAAAAAVGAGAGAAAAPHPLLDATSGGRGGSLAGVVVRNNPDTVASARR